MTKRQLIERIARLPDDAEVVAEFADQGVGGNATSPIESIRVEGTYRDRGTDRETIIVDGLIVLITEHAI